MALPDSRALPLPAGDNATDTFIAGVHLNKTTLEQFNYTLYTNNTLSNASGWCILAFQPYLPATILPNGTWINETWCYRPVDPIGERAGIGIGFAILYAIGLGLTLFVLRKHGRLHLPAEKRFYPIGRRWQWYWALFTCAAAIISLFTNVDVDRYYLPELPIILTSFFWYLMQLGSMAIVWEAVRHWGSWMERQFVDPDPFILREEGRRWMFEFWVPLVWYLFWWLNFFLIVPRNWGKIEHQRYPEQIVLEAIPGATDGRFKAAPFLLVLCWAISVFYLRHAIKHYCPRSQGIVNRVVGLFRNIPLRFYLLLPLSAVVPTYQALVAWYFAWSPLNVTGLNVAIYAGGYTPTLLIIYIQVVYGFVSPNEDLELKRQRRARGAQIDQELGITPKPGWWQRIRDAAEGVNANESVQDRLARQVREVRGTKPSPKNAGVTTKTTTRDGTTSPALDAVEMDPMPARPFPHDPVQLIGQVAPGVFPSVAPAASPYDGLGERTRQARIEQHAMSLLNPNMNEEAAAAARRREELMMDGPPPYSEAAAPPYVSPSLRPTELGRGTSIASTTASINGPPQQIRSMLDV